MDKRFSQKMNGNKILKDQKQPITNHHFHLII